jgi:hypothetical protein
MTWFNKSVEFERGRVQLRRQEFSFLILLVRKSEMKLVISELRLEYQELRKINIALKCVMENLKMILWETSQYSGNIWEYLTCICCGYAE